MSRFNKSSRPARAVVRVERADPVSDTEATAIVSIEKPDGETTEQEVPLTVIDGIVDISLDEHPSSDQPKKKRRLGRRKNKEEEQHG